MDPVTLTAVMLAIVLIIWRVFEFFDNGPDQPA